MKLARATPAELDAIFAEDTRSVWVCSPWVTRDGLELLKAAMARCNISLLWSFELWTRVDQTEREAGITDYDAIDAFFQFLEEEAPDLKIAIYTAPRLHAKAVWTDSGALVGSANLTGKGFGDNIEVTMRLDREESAAVASLRDELRPQLQLVTRDAWQGFVRGTPLPGPTPPPATKASAWEDFRERLLQGRDPGGIR
jgi:phosphatidylserine/phosphatidylglycerophosphate/cardiolipin synthase-like enzyme